MPPRSAKTMAAKRSSPYSRPRRRSAYRSMTTVRRVPRNINAGTIYKYNQYSYPVTLAHAGTSEGNFTSSNTNVVLLGTPIADGTSNTYFCGGIITPRLNNLDGVSSFAGMYDQFRIKGVKVTFTPLFNTSQYPQVNITNTGTSNGGIQGSPIPELIIARDYDDTEVPEGTSMEFALMQRQDVQMHRMDTVRSYYMKLKPRVPNVTTVTSGGVVSNGISVGTGNEWIDINSGGLVYPSFKFVLRYLNLNQYQSLSFRIDCKYYIEFKNVR